MPREKIFEKLIPSMFRLEPAQKNALRTAARAEKISDSEYLRRLIDTHIVNTHTNAEKAETTSA